MWLSCGAGPCQTVFEVHTVCGMRDTDVRDTVTATVLQCYSVQYTVYRLSQGPMLRRS